jgi:glycosyltransferase involved in cell wall biosynthesis
MRIAVDVRDLLIAKTGNRTYLEELSRALPEVTDRHKFIFLAPRWKPPAGNTVWHKILGHISLYLWKEVELPWRAWREGCDVVFCTDYIVPLFYAGETIPVFHDAGFWERPQDYNRLWRLLLDVLALPAARRSAATITVSQFSKQRLASLTGISRDRLRVVFEAPKSMSLAPQDLQSSKTTLARYDLVDKPFLLHVGVLEKRKNLPRLVEAFALAKQELAQDYRLVLVGQPGPKRDMDDSLLIKKTIHNLGLEQSVIMTGYISDEELPVFYQNANCYAFPSLYEGFGLPILEAFANDLPLVAANCASLPEIAGDAALFFDPYDIEDMAQQIVCAVNDDTARNRLVEAGRKRIREFSWETAAREIIEIMELVGEPQPINYDA